MNNGPDCWTCWSVTFLPVTLQLQATCNYLVLCSSLIKFRKFERHKYDGNSFEYIGFLKVRLEKDVGWFYTCFGWIGLGQIMLDISRVWLGLVCLVKTVINFTVAYDFKPLLKHFADPLYSLHTFCLLLVLSLIHI